MTAMSCVTEDLSGSSSRMAATADIKDNSSPWAWQQQQQQQQQEQPQVPLTGQLLIATVIDGVWFLF
jgi:hypothetical protein